MARTKKDRRQDFDPALVVIANEHLGKGKKCKLYHVVNRASGATTWHRAHVYMPTPCAGVWHCVKCDEQVGCKECGTHVAGITNNIDRCVEHQSNITGINGMARNLKSGCLCKPIKKRGPRKKPADTVQIYTQGVAFG